MNDLPTPSRAPRHQSTGALDHSGKRKNELPVHRATHRATHRDIRPV